MSRVGKNPVAIPDGVEIDVRQTEIRVKGQKGELVAPVNDLVRTEHKDGKFSVRPVDENNPKARAMWGTTRAIVANMVIGVTSGFSRELEINGVGFRAQVQGSNLFLQLGFSHDIYYPIPSDLKVECPKPTSVKVSGADKQRVGQFAAEIRAMRPPEPYKGKGIRYIDETILRKEGKKK
ncbi:50S ribosomal protein L6 [Rhodovibrio sodomensis]|uniref:Large ribosomal subunit protein uL6 n=1 Tax=Rhodovibrio sodomensis TaxID=1088 RepID=A0ABS1DAU7_9PROT|nr:50S ribosomal protein L6 [Rhodovibrio sodomensis]MBK1666848.1 50S ribosomal protein L6 [Rhodovibrio sodomensis]